MSNIRHIARDIPWLRTAQWVWEKVRIPALRRIMQTGYVRVMIEEYQTRSLGVDVDINPYIGRRVPPAPVLQQLTRGQRMEEVFARAKRRLDSMPVVGTAERFAETMELLCDHLGIPAPEAPPEYNIGPGRKLHQSYRQSGDVSPDLTALIDCHTAYDRELHAYASQLLDQRLARKRATDALNAASNVGRG